MPVYEFECLMCGKVTDHYLPSELRTERQDCPQCGADKSADYRISAPLVGTEVKRGSARVIHDERQVTDDQGAHWREKGTTGNPGGAGRKLHFH